MYKLHVVYIIKKTYFVIENMISLTDLFSKAILKHYKIFYFTTTTHAYLRF